MKEIAGTRVYDNKKKESLKIFEETKEKMEKSVLLLEIMDKRLKTLESEKEELKEYQKQDKLRRALKYSLLKTEVNNCKKEFDKLSKQRRDLQATVNDAEKVKYDYTKKISALEGELQSYEKLLSAELANIRNEEAKLESDRVIAALKSRDLEDQVNQERDGRNFQAGAEEKLKEVLALIEAKERELEEIRPQYTKVVEEQAKIFGELNNIKRRRAELYSKTDGDKAYTSVEEHFKDNIENFSKAYVKAMKEETDQWVQEIETKIEEKLTRMNDLSHQDDTRRQQIDATTRIVHDKQLAPEEVANQLGEQKTNFYLLKLHSIRNTDGKYDEYINGYHGIVIKLMSSENTYFKALEATAASTLSHHVVDSQKHAIFFLDEINKRRMTGQCTFYALNRVHVPEQRQLQDRNGRHLLSVVKYYQKFATVFRSIFGNTILVKDIPTGRKIAFSERFNCITFDGEEINSSGSRTGGYVDSKKSRLDTMKNLKLIEPTLEDLRKRANVLSKNVLKKRMNYLIYELNFLIMNKNV